MKRTMATLLTFLVLADARAEGQTTVYGPDGRVQSRILTAPNGSAVVYGADGRVQARSTTSPTNGATTVYRSDGQRLGTIAPPPATGGRR